MSCIKFNMNYCNDKCCYLHKLKKGVYDLDYYINKYNLFRFKYIYKGTKKFKIISKEELLEEKYAVYYFDNVDYTEHFTYLNGLITFMTKPLPDIKYLKKIKIK